MDLYPNIHGAGASLPWNNPVLDPYLGLPEGSELSIGEVPDNAATDNEGMGYIATPQGPHNMLMDLRNKFPFVPIVPIPTWYKTVRLVQNVPVEIRFPTGLIMAMFKGSAPYLMSGTGNASLPVAGDGDGTQSIFMPDNIWYYVGNTKSISVIAPDTGTLVSFQGQYFHELPRY